VLYGDQTAETTVSVNLDPRLNISIEDLQASEQIVEKILASGEKTAKAIDILREAKETIALVNKKAKDRDADTQQKLKEQGKSLTTKIDALWLMIIPTSDIQGIYREPAIRNWIFLPRVLPRVPSIACRKWSS